MKAIQKKELFLYIVPIASHHWQWQKYALKNLARILTLLQHVLRNNQGESGDYRPDTHKCAFSWKACFGKNHPK
jgi:hypothetical protein